MDNINYICKRIKQIYSQYYDEINTIIKEYEKTYRLHIFLKGYKSLTYECEIDKNINSVGEIINYICKEIDKKYNIKGE